MASQLISKTLLAKLQPKEKPYDVWDARVTGFLVRVYPSGKMSYFVQYARGRRKKLGQVGVLGLNAAREKAIELINIHHQGEDVDRYQKYGSKPHTLTLQTFIEKEYRPWFLAHAKTGQKILNQLAAAFKDFLNKPLASITAYDLEQWRSAELKRLKPATVNRYLGSFKAIFAKAREWGFISEDLVYKIKALPVDPIGYCRFLSEKEQRDLLKALNDREAKAGSSKNFSDHLMPMVLTALNTGLRKGELCTLKKEQVNLRQKYVSQLGKNGKVRHIPLNDTAYNALRDWIKQTKSEYLFPNPNRSDAPIKDIKSSWKNLMKDAGIKNFRWHDMRHHFASQLVMAGVPLNTVRELLDHSDIKMTLRYAHLAPEYKVEAVRKIEFDY